MLQEACTKNNDYSITIIRLNHQLGNRGVGRDFSRCVCVGGGGGGGRFKWGVFKKVLFTLISSLTLHIGNV